MNWKRMGALMAIIYGIMALLPLFVGGTDHLMHILIMCLIWAVVASCWDLIMGFAGIFSFGQVAFFVIGAYASAILARTFAIHPLGAMVLAGGVDVERRQGARAGIAAFDVEKFLGPGRQFLQGGGETAALHVRQQQAARLCDFIGGEQVLEVDQHGIWER